MATTWNQAFEDSPADSNDPSEGALRIRELKEAIQERIVKEHEFTLTDSFADQAWHKGGSAKGYYKSAEPSNRPDGSTALDSDDAGRLWVDSDDGRLYVYTGSAWDALTPGTAQSDEINSLTAAEIQQLANIGSTTISAAQWGYLGGLDQALSTTDDVTFNSVTGTVAASNVTEISNLTAAEGAQLENINSVTLTNANWQSLETYADNALTATELGELQNIGSVTISGTQWGYLGALDQGLTKSSNVEFDELKLTGRYNVDARTITGNKTQNEVYDTLSSYLANGDTMLVNGSVDKGSYLLIATYAEKPFNGRVIIYGYSSNADAAVTQSFDDGDGTSLNLHIAW